MKPLSQEPSHTWRSFPYTTNTWTVSSSCRSSSLPQHELMTHQPLITRESLLTSMRNSPEPGTRLKQSLALTVCCVHSCHPKIACQRTTQIDWKYFPIRWVRHSPTNLPKLKYSQYSRLPCTNLTLLVLNLEFEALFVLICHASAVLLYFTFKYVMTFYHC